jgi:hypothetical protein
LRAPWCMVVVAEETSERPQECVEEWRVRPVICEAQAFVIHCGTYDC